MNDWATRLDRFLEFDERDILKDAGKITMHFAKEFAETEFEKYRIIQDRLFESDFDKLLKLTAPEKKTKTVKKTKPPTKKAKSKKK